MSIQPPRPHVIGWGEEFPVLPAGVTCSLCGKIGAHDVIVLGESETKAILKDMRRPE